MKDNYLQHNPTVKNGKAGFLKMQPQIDIINISADQNMVYVFFKYTLVTGQINKVCNIYRLEAGKLAEHWDVIEHNVENIHSINNNSIF